MYDYKDCINRYLGEKQQKNTLYSLRAFARDLDISPSILSKILNDKKTPSLALGTKIAIALKLGRNEQRLFIDSLSKKIVSEQGSIDSKDLEIVQFDIDNYEIVSKWYHYAILELTFVDNFQSDSSWIANELGISEQEVNDAISRLLSVGLLEEVDGALKKRNKNITTSNKHLTTPGLMEYQKQILNLAHDCVDKVEHDKRSMQSMTMAIDPEKIDIAKKMIQSFLSDICDYLESGEQKKVYQVGVSLFPLQKENKS